MVMRDYRECKAEVLDFLVMAKMTEVAKVVKRLL